MQSSQIDAIGKQYKKLLKQKLISIKAAEACIEKIQNNIYCLLEVFKISERIFTGQNIALLHKINCLSFLKLLLETGQCLPVTLFEIYFLPIIESILISRTQAANYGYYEDLGFTQAKVIQQYQNLANQIIQIGSAVKPYRMYQYTELSEPSMFRKSAQKIINYTSESFIIDKSLADNYNHNFIASSKKFQEGERGSDQFIRFYAKKTIGLIESGPTSIMNQKNGDKFNLRAMLRYGSYHINYQVLGVCVDIIETDNNISNKTHALNLLNEMLIWGDVQAIIIINYSDVLDNLHNKIYVDKNAYKIFKDIPNQISSKQKFFTTFLKYIELWANLIPYENWVNPNNTTRSNVHQIQCQLRSLSHPPLIFPENQFSKTLINQFNANMKTNTQINKIVVQDLHCKSISASNKMSLSKSDTYVNLKLKKTVDNVVNLLICVQQNLRKLETARGKDAEQLQKQIYEDISKLNKEKKTIRKDTDQLLNNDTSINSNNNAILEESAECLDIISHLNKIYMKFPNKQKQPPKNNPLKKSISDFVKKIYTIKAQDSINSQNNANKPEDSIKMFISQKFRNSVPSRNSFEKQNLVSSVKIYDKKQQSSIRQNLKCQKIPQNPFPKIQNSKYQRIIVSQNQDDLQLNKINNPISNAQFNPKYSKNSAVQFKSVLNIEQDLIPSNNLSSRTYKIASDSNFKIRTPSKNNRYSRCKTQSQEKARSILFNRQKSPYVIKPILNKQYDQNYNTSNLHTQYMSKQKQYHPATFKQAAYMNQQKDAKNIINNIKQNKLVQQDKGALRKRIFNQDNSRSSGKPSKQVSIFSRKSSSDNSNFVVSNVTSQNQKKTLLILGINSNENSKNASTNLINSFTKKQQNKQLIHQQYGQTKKQRIKTQNKAGGTSQKSMDGPWVITSMDYLLKNQDNKHKNTEKTIIDFDIMKSQTSQFERFNGKFKRKLLRSRNSIIKNQDAEIGCIIYKNDQNLLMNSDQTEKLHPSQIKISYYITAYKTLKDFRVAFDKISQLKIEVTKQEKQLEQGKQYRLDFYVEMLEYRYRLPQVKFSYQSKNKMSSSFKTILPAPPTKFLISKYISDEQLRRQFLDNQRQSKLPILSTQIIPYEICVLKKDVNILENYLNLKHFYTLQNGTSFLGGSFNYKNYEFLLKVAMKQNDFISFEGKVKKQQSQQFMLHCLCQLESMFRSDNEL